MTFTQTFIATALATAVGTAAFAPRFGVHIHLGPTELRGREAASFVDGCGTQLRKYF